MYIHSAWRCLSSFILFIDSFYRKACPSVCTCRFLSSKVHCAFTSLSYPSSIGFNCLFGFFRLVYFISGKIETEEKKKRCLLETRKKGLFWIGLKEKEFDKQGRKMQLSENKAKIKPNRREQEKEEREVVNKINNIYFLSLGPISLSLSVFFRFLLLCFLICDKQRWCSFCLSPSIDL